MHAQRIRLWMTTMVWLLCVASAHAQATEGVSGDEPVSEDAGDESKPMPKSIGGMPDPPRGYYENYTSPLKTIGTGMFAGGYVVNVAVSLVYLAFVYPLQALFGTSKV